MLSHGMPLRYILFWIYTAISVTETREYESSPRFDQIRNSVTYKNQYYFSIIKLIIKLIFNCHVNFQIFVSPALSLPPWIVAKKDLRLSFLENLSLPPPLPFSSPFLSWSNGLKTFGEFEKNDVKFPSVKYKHESCVLFFCTKEEYRVTKFIVPCRSNHFLFLVVALDNQEWDWIQIHKLSRRFNNRVCLWMTLNRIVLLMYAGTWYLCVAEAMGELFVFF